MNLMKIHILYIRVMWSLYMYVRVQNLDLLHVYTLCMYMYMYMYVANTTWNTFDQLFTPAIESTVYR